MKLRNKILIGIGVVWVLFLVLTYAGSEYFLLRSFLSLEKDRADRDLSRVDQALDQNNYALYTFTSDWTHWNDLYDYLQGKNPGFIPNNINMTALVNSTVNLMMFWDLKGNLLTGIAADTDNAAYVPYPKGLDKFLYTDSLLLSRKDVNSDIRGYILVDNHIMEIVAAASTDGDKVKPPLGIMITGRFISPKIVQKIEETTKLKLELLTPPLIDGNLSYKKVFEAIANAPKENGHFNQPIDFNNLEGFSMIRDINNNPIGMFRMVTPRAIYQTGVEAIKYYLYSFIALGVIFSFIMLAFLRKLIIQRLERLDREVAEIGTKNLLNQRVNSAGNDELSTVSKQINVMLDIIETSHNKLEQRVQERTEELQKTNVQLEQEIVERKNVEKELIIHKEHLVRLAHYDGLTSLPNRVFFNEMLNKSISHATKQHKKLAILFVDLDRFKTINDALGHTIGDLVLKEIANRFAECLKAGDILARLGGDEFIVLLTDISHPKYVASIAEKLLSVLSDPVKIQKHEFHIKASIGICIFPDDGLSLEDLQKNADMAMYKAKRSGGGLHEFYTQAMNLAANEHMQLEAALRKALANNQFVLHYQPKLALSDGSIIGVEALIRWENPEVGLISPAKFIPIAEDTGLIMQIGEWTLREACRTAKKWQDLNYQPISVAVNLSPKQFRHQDIAAMVQSVLTETNLDPKYLEMEITETAVMDDIDTATKKLSDIQNMGVGIAIDDFGTGYTSISYLKQFPISTIKIDQSFIKGIPQNQNDMSITSAVIALAHSLNIKVVAEGVETAEQLQYLADHDCDIVQGYYLSRPLTEDKLLLQLPKLTEAAKKATAQQ